MKRLKRPLLICFAIVIAMAAFVACNTVPENGVVKMTPTDENAASATPDTQVIASATVARTATAEPTATADATTELTATQKPTSTVKPSATGAATAKPTATVKPTAAATPKKTPTATKKPTATKTPVKTATPKPTATAQKEVYQTIEYEGKTYKVLMGRNGNPNLIKDYSTLPEALQAYAYPTFDKEAVMMDVYKYAKTKGFKYFYNPNIPLRKESSIGETDYPESFVPGGNMTEELALEAFSWDSPMFYTYPGDSFYTANYTEVDGIIETREFYPSMVNSLANDRKNSLCLWIPNYCDSSYREDDSFADGLYNGKYTKEYAVYFMYGGYTDLVQEVKI